jgi:hypothetical protein
MSSGNGGERAEGSAGGEEKKEAFSISRSFGPYYSNEDPTYVLGKSIQAYLSNPKFDDIVKEAFLMADDDKNGELDKEEVRETFRSVSKNFGVDDVISDVSKGFVSYR